MEFEWDVKKARTNLLKHGINFADAATVLLDDFALTILDQDSEEERYVTIGTDALSHISVVVYTWRGNKVRLISARKATLQERNQYGEHHEKRI